MYHLVTSDDILAKYRKPVVHKSADGVAAGPPAVADGVAKSKEKGDDEVPLYDSNNLEMCQAFLDAKKKLRLILSSVDLQVSSSDVICAIAAVTLVEVEVLNTSLLATTTTTTTVLQPFVRDYPGEPVPEEILTHPPS